jgi:3-phenylpropionate/cinnamic acid dioxygenase small subunit
VRKWQEAKRERKLLIRKRRDSKSKLERQVNRMAKNKTKTQQPKQKKIIQHLVRNDKVSVRESQGWKVVRKHKDRKQIEYQDLTLMEKAV